MAKQASYLVSVLRTAAASAAVAVLGLACGGADQVGTAPAPPPTLSPVTIAGGTTPPTQAPTAIAVDAPPSVPEEPSRAPIEPPATSPTNPPSQPSPTATATSMPARPTPTPSAIPQATATATPTEVSLAPAVAADFGDAPDGSDAHYPGRTVIAAFPTLRANDGARVLNPGQDLLGERVSGERDADDAADPDGVPNLVGGDAHDDGLRLFQVVLAGPQPSVNIAFAATISPDALPGPRFFNVLIDRNLDGRWSGTGDDRRPEWVIRNWVEMPQPGQTILIQPPPTEIAYGGLLPDGAWLRAVLSREPILADAWDGRGTFEYGEVEDYQVFLPRAIDAAGGAQPVPAATLTCPQVVDFGAFPVAPLTCTAANFGGAGAPGWTVQGGSGGWAVPELALLKSLETGGSAPLNLLAFRGTQDGGLKLIPNAEPSPFEINADGTITMEMVPAQAGTRLLSGEPRCPGCAINDPAADNDFFEHPAWVAQPFGWTDITAAAAWVVRGEYLNVWFNDGDPLACGAREFAGPDSRVLCTVEGAIMLDGEALVVAIELADPPPADPDTALVAEYSLLVDTFGPANDNWRVLGDLSLDIRQGTDFWHLVSLLPGAEIEYRARLVRAGNIPIDFPTRGRALVFDRFVVFITPTNEFGLDDPILGVRLAAMGWDTSPERRITDRAGSADTAGSDGAAFESDALVRPPLGPELLAGTPPGYRPRGV